MAAGIRSRRPIRIVHCISEMTIGGAEAQLAELIGGLPRDRFEQMLVLVKGGGPLVERVRAAGCRVVELGYGLAGDELRAFRPDIVQGQLFWSNLLSVAAGRMAGVPTIVTSRLALSCHDREPRWMKHALNLANRFTTAIFANSEAVRRDVLAHERVRPERIVVIPNGVVLEQFGRERPEVLRHELGLERAGVVLVTVANLHAVKGHEELLQAVARLRDRHPDLHLLLPGRDRGMLPRLRAIIGELALDGQVSVLGERNDIPRLLAAADIFVHPSREEGFSNAILEGMSAGKPVVATAVGGNPEAVRDGVDGLLVPPRDPDALAAAIDRLASDRALRERMGESGRQRIATEFSMARMIERFAAWYESLSGPHAEARATRSFRRRWLTLARTDPARAPARDQPRSR
jgi:glycosyltransferase involved in cell wall biosynthesis